MKRIILIIFIVCTLSGCSSSDELNQQTMRINALVDEMAYLKEENEALKDTVDRLKADLKNNMNTSDELLTDIDILKSQPRSSLSPAYSDYMILFAYDIVQQLDDYSTHDGVITEYDGDNDLMKVAPVEFIYINDNDRIKALNIDIETSRRHGDVIVYIDYENPITYKISKDFKLYVFEWEGSGGLVETSMSNIIETSADEGPTYNFSIVNGEVLRMTENYYN